MSKRPGQFGPEQQSLEDDEKAYLQEQVAEDRLKDAGYDVRWSEDPEEGYGCCTRLNGHRTPWFATASELLTHVEARGGIAMDSNALLKDLQNATRIALERIASGEEHPPELATLAHGFEELDRWISVGGAYPDAWKRARRWARGE